MQACYHPVAVCYKSNILIKYGLLQFCSNLIAGAVMSDRLVQVNIRLAESSADRLKGLAESSGLKLGPFVERMIAAYSADSSLLQNDSSAVQWQSVVEELRGIVASQEKRLNRIELAIQSGLGGRDAMVRVKIEPADNGPVEPELDSPSHQASPSIPNAQEAKAQYERQLDERIIALRNQGMGIKKIQAELGIGQKRVYKGLKAAGLVE